MIVRKANPKDAKQIRNIAKTLRSNPEKLQSNGFVPSVLPEKEYAERALLSEYFYVILDKDKIIGYMMCYDNSTVNYLMREGKFAYQDEFIVYLSKIHEPYIFGDQIAILPEYFGLETGKLLIAAAIKDLRKAKIYRFEGCVSSASEKIIPSFVIKRYRLKKASQIRRRGNVLDIYSGKLPN